MLDLLTCCQKAVQLVSCHIVTKGMDIICLRTKEIGPGKVIQPLLIITAAFTSTWCQKIESLQYVVSIAIITIF